MAGYKGHIVGGVVLGGVYAGVLNFVPFEHFVEMAGVLHNWQALAAVMVISILFALFPDIDTNSKGQNIFYGLALAMDVLLIWSGNIQAAAYLGVIAMLPIVGKHRGWTHSKLAMILVPLPIVIVPYLYNDKILWASALFYGAAVVGYFSHLLLDGLIVSWFRIKSKETW
jgi:membrane-bound metal-dependent hydrolase YbcI (DUF457 family)